MACRFAIGLPNWMRSLAYATAASRAAWAMPSACAPIPIRPPSSVFMAILKPSPSSPSSASGGHQAVGEVQRRRARPADPELVLGLADGEAGGVPFDDEGAHPAGARRVRVGLGEDDVDLGEGGVGDEDLRPVQDVGVVLEHRRARAGRGVGPGGGLGQGERAQAAAGGHVGEVLVLLGLVAESVNGEGGQRGVRGHDDARGRARPRHFLQRDHVAHVVRPGAAVFLRDRAFP